MVAKVFKKTAKKSKPKAGGKAVRTIKKKATASRKTSRKEKEPAINPSTHLYVMQRHQIFLSESMHKDLKLICQYNSICQSELFRTIVREWLVAHSEGKAVIKIEGVKKSDEVMVRVQIHLADRVVDKIEEILEDWVKKTKYKIKAGRLKSQLLREIFTDWLNWEKQRFNQSAYAIKAPKKPLFLKKDKEPKINYSTNVYVMARHQIFLPEAMVGELKAVCHYNGVCRSELFRTVVREWLAAYKDGKAEIKIKRMKKNDEAMVRVQLFLTYEIMNEISHILENWVKKTKYKIKAGRLKSQLFRQIFTDWMTWKKQSVDSPPYKLKSPKKKS